MRVYRHLAVLLAAVSYLPLGDELAARILWSWRHIIVPFKVLWLPVLLCMINRLGVLARREILVGRRLVKLLSTVHYICNPRYLSLSLWLASLRIHPVVGFFRAQLLRLLRRSWAEGISVTTFIIILGYRAPALFVVLLHAHGHVLCLSVVFGWLDPTSAAEQVLVIHILDELCR